MFGKIDNFGPCEYSSNLDWTTHTSIIYKLEIFKFNTPGVVRRSWWSLSKDINIGGNYCVLCDPSNLLFRVDIKNREICNWTFIFIVWIFWHLHLYNCCPFILYLDQECSLLILLFIQLLWRVILMDMLKLKLFYIHNFLFTM